MSNNLPTVNKFFTGKNIFITGATGFVGKPLVEKLLRSCPDVGNIYILMREKKGKNIPERLKKMFDDKLYDTLKATNSNLIEKKVIPLKGDCMELGLGLSKEDREVIVNNVSVIFHVAASVRFDDKLRDAIFMNARGTREVAQLALETKNLQVLMHVSTTFCNCNLSHEIEEKFYECPTNWREAITMAEEMDPDLLSIMTKKYLGDHPNTYTFSKALGEHVVKDMCSGRVPVKIVRPSIVVSTLSDPVPGWIDNFNGPVGLLVACGKGLMRSSYQQPHITGDFIPVDVVVKSLLVAAWDLGLRQNKTEPELMHCSSGYFKWLTIGEMIKIGKDLSAEIPFNSMLWVPKGAPTTCPVIAYFNLIFFHLIPALFLDVIIKAAGHKPLLFKLQTKIYNASLQLRYFTFQEWKFHNQKLFELNSKILPQEFGTWDYEFRNKDVLLFLKNAMLGSRKYLLNETDDTLPQAKKNYQRMWWLDRITMFLFYSFLFWIVIHVGLIEVISDKIQSTSSSTLSILNSF